MGSYLIRVPDFADDEVFVDEDDARAIFYFYWPEKASQIASLKLTKDALKFAQTLLVAGVDASYALGYIGILTRSMYNPGQGLLRALNKLAKGAAKHWFQHATAKDLTNPKIAYSVRVAIIGAVTRHWNDLLMGQELSSFKGLHIFAHVPAAMGRA